MAPTLVVGRDVRVVRETDDGLELIGPVRLRPGSLVDVLSSSEGSAAPRRLAIVWTWRLVAVGSTGPAYRGTCRWQWPSGHELPQPDRACGGIEAPRRAHRWHQS
jgi:hypothetical protein